MNQKQLNQIFLAAQKPIANSWDKACEAGDIIERARKFGKQQITLELAAALVKQNEYFCGGWDMAKVQETLDILKVYTLLLGDTNVI